MTKKKFFFFIKNVTCIVNKPESKQSLLESDLRIKLHSHFVINPFDAHNSLYPTLNMLKCIAASKIKKVM